MMGGVVTRACEPIQQDVSYIVFASTDHHHQTPEVIYSAMLLIYIDTVKSYIYIYVFKFMFVDVVPNLSHLCMWCPRRA